MKNYLKRILAVFLSFFFILLSFMFYPLKANALSGVDQACSTGVSGSTQYTFLSHIPIQTFVPTKNTLDAVQVYVKGEIGNPASIKLTVTKGNIIASSVKTISNSWGWVTFDFNDVPMSFDLYGITLTDVSGNSVWKHGPANCYDRGYAVYDNTLHMEFDYGFAVNAYDSSSDQDTNNTNTNNNTSSGSTVGTGAAPASTISSSIVAPSNLTVEDIPGDHGNSLFLKWYPSSTGGIDGYKIFRSESANSGFIEIARTQAIVGGYIDYQATTGKTFYYLVRAYKGNLESASSNIASGKSVDDVSDILNDYKNNSGGILGDGIFGLGIVAVIIILGLIFLVVVEFVVFILIVSRRRSSNPPTSSTAPPAPQSSPQKPENEKK